MFYQYESIGSFYEKYLFFIHKKLNRKKFLRAAKVQQGSFAEGMFSRMYDFITSEAIDLKREYEKYYGKEYRSFQEFLRKKMNITERMIENIMKTLEKKPELILYRKDWSTYGNYNIGTFILSDEIQEKIEKTLMMEDLTNEN